MADETPTQQRLIDHVTISIEPSTPLEAKSSSFDGLLMITIGYPGHGGVMLWLHRSEAHRVIRVIAQAMSLPPAPARVGLGGSGFTPEDDEPLPIAVVEEEAVPF